MLERERETAGGQDLRGENEAQLTGTNNGLRRKGKASRWAGAHYERVILRCENVILSRRDGEGLAQGVQLTDAELIAGTPCEVPRRAAPASG